MFKLNLCSNSYGCKKLSESSAVVISREASCCSLKYIVSSEDGILFRSSDGNYTTRYKMFDKENMLIIETDLKRKVFKTPYMVVETASEPPLKVISAVGLGLGSFGVLITDQQDQIRLKISKPTFSTTYKILNKNDVEIGNMKISWGEWSLCFPLDLDLSYKAALIATCMYIDFLTAAYSQNM